MGSGPRRALSDWAVGFLWMWDSSPPPVWDGPVAPVGYSGLYFIFVLYVLHLKPVAPWDTLVCISYVFSMFCV